MAFWDGVGVLDLGGAALSPDFSMERDSVEKALTQKKLVPLEVITAEYIDGLLEESGVIRAKIRALIKAQLKADEVTGRNLVMENVLETYVRKTLAEDRRLMREKGVDRFRILGLGESEKNIKEVFTHYRRLCHTSEVMPILFFNEADAIINKRTENVEHSVDKMDNAMQNIILQEIEALDGILIVTTNLTSNLDKAFERRFLYKMEFHKPNTEVKTKIWRSMLKDISADDAHQLASHFDFSGGQIENIARKRTVDYILSGKFASLGEIEDYCRAELLVNKNARRIGFTS